MLQTFTSASENMLDFTEQYWKIIQEITVTDNYCKLLTTYGIYLESFETIETETNVEHTQATNT